MTKYYTLFKRDLTTNVDFDLSGVESDSPDQTLQSPVRGSSTSIGLNAQPFPPCKSNTAYTQLLITVRTSFGDYVNQLTQSVT